MFAEIIKKYKVLLILALVVLAGALIFFYRMYQNDMKALDGFVASYEKFDTAVSDFSISEVDSLSDKAQDSLSELTHAASFQLSSLIKNDNIIPLVALEIADFSGKELYNLVAYKKAIQNKTADVDILERAYAGMASKRRSAYAHFQELIK